MERAEIEFEPSVRFGREAHASHVVAVGALAGEPTGQWRGQLAFDATSQRASTVCPGAGCLGEVLDQVGIEVDHHL